jgi:hypothetical protein
VSHGRYVIFQMAEVAIARQMFQEILRLIAELRPQPPPALAQDVRWSCVQGQQTGGVRPYVRKNRQMRPSNAVRTVRDAETIDTPHLGFRSIQKIATIHATSGFIRGIPNNTQASRSQSSSAAGSTPDAVLRVIAIG